METPIIHTRIAKLFPRNYIYKKENERKKVWEGAKVFLLVVISYLLSISRHGIRLPIFASKSDIIESSFFAMR